jgi:hypothetical protein
VYIVTASYSVHKQNKFEGHENSRNIFALRMISIENS